jgi:hypothetical protein
VSASQSGLLLEELLLQLWIGRGLRRLLVHMGLWRGKGSLAVVLLRLLKGKVILGLVAVELMRIRLRVMGEWLLLLLGLLLRRLMLRLLLLRRRRLLPCLLLDGRRLWRPREAVIRDKIGVELLNRRVALLPRWLGHYLRLAILGNRRSVRLIILRRKAKLVLIKCLGMGMAAVAMRMGMGLSPAQMIDTFIHVQLLLLLPIHVLVYVVEGRVDLLLLLRRLRKLLAKRHGLMASMKRGLVWRRAVQVGLEKGALL